MPDSYRFGSAEVRPAERALLIGGAPVALGGRAFDLLVALLERPGKLVTKDELLDAVWGRVIVEEGNLHVHISTLRKLLGAGLIVTIPGRGYRLERAAGVAAPPAAEAANRAGASAGAGDFSPTGLFGRDNDLASLDSLLRDHRLVTIAGPGGIGKTRLARAAMGAARARYPDGVAMVELAALSDPALIPGAIAAALQLPLGAAGDPLATVTAAVRPLRMLVLLDNAEQVVDGVARLAQGLLQGDGVVRLLVTSQAPLKLDEERLYRLGGLEVPEPAENLRADEALTYGAVALFDERVRAADRHFRLTDANVGAVVSICRQLDGIALALELAAARCPLLGLQMVSQRLDERFRLLRSGSRTAPSRQQTLQAAMDWSHALLSPEQQCAFRQLGVFAGGFTLDLARQVLHQPGIDEWGSVDLLAELVERSLVAVAEGDAPRYRLLETGRAYALEKLVQAGDLGALRQRHAHALRELFETAYDACWVLPEAEFVARYEPELDNLRGALDWAAQHEPQTAIALAGASARLWRWLSLHPEALRRCDAARALLDAATPPALAARLWEAIAQLSGEISSAESRPAAKNALSLYEQLGDARGRYLALGHIAFSYRATAPEAEAAHAAMQALEDPLWPPAVRLLGTKVAGGLASDAGRIEQARAAHEARLALATAAGSEREVNAALGNLADLALIAGDADSAVRLGRELLARLGRRHMTTRAIALGNLLLALLAQGALVDARRTLGEFVAVARQLGFMFLMYTADAMALLAARERRWAAAGRLLGYADAGYTGHGQPREPNEASARDTTWALLAGNCAGQDVEAWLAAGAVLQPAAVCLLALEPPTTC